MTTIWKFRLAAADEQVIQVPVGSRVLTVQMQIQTPTIWVLVEDPRAALLPRTVRIFGTGHPLREVSLTTHCYAGTVQDLHGGTWHVFVENE